MNNTKRIDKVTIKHLSDPTGEADHLGRYSTTPGPAERTVDRQALADWKPGEYRYFIAAMSPEETGNPDSVIQDYKRMEAGNNGEWHYIGIRAEADIVLTGDTVQRITSGGLWGIESDCPDYHKEVEKEELESLKGELISLGFPVEEIETAFASVIRHVES